ncbi:MAG: ribonucleoside-diphosphate reductase [Anaerolineaceae bacterium]|nr:ribonucleoside-diphosphate reductase [Anaerolineaceae bacterium]
MVQTKAAEKNALHELGYKIFLDRYAQKDMTRSTLAVGDTVIVVVDSKTGQREIGTVTAINMPKVTVQLLDGDITERDIEQVDKPLETDPGQMMDRVAAGIAAIEKNSKLRKQWTERFRWMLDDWKFVPAGRILTAAGTDQLLTYYNCYVVPSPKDSRGGIIETLRQMTEIMSRGGGVGINISSLRPRHWYVKGVNGRSSGAVSWGALYSFVTGLIEQGGSRRGALMLILNDWHPDVFDFINSKRKAGQVTNANISVGVSDKLMEAVKADGDWDLKFPDTGDPEYDDLWDGDIDKWIADGHEVIPYKTVKAREIWNAIIESAWASAEPGVFFNERYNKMSNSHYFAPIICTNPCVTGDTRIHTNRGLVKARELFDNETEIEVTIDGRFGLTNATTPSTRVFRTGVKPVFRLQTEEGYFVRATADHRFMTPSGWMQMNQLKTGDKIHILNRKGGFGEQGSLELGRVLGWLVGDGTVKSDEAVLSFFGEEKQELAPMFAEHVNDLVAPLTKNQTRTYTVGIGQVVERDEARVSSARLHQIAEQYGLTETKHRVPESVFQGSEVMQRGFLQALFTADGSFQDGGVKGASIRLAANQLELLEGVQQLLGNFGIASRIYRNRRDAGYRMMPDSNREPKSYWCEAQHELVISKQNMAVFAEEIGFMMDYKQTGLEDYISRGKRGPYMERFTATVESIVSDGIEEVFDLTESATHSFVGNNLVVHNCGEQGLPAFGVCNLGAINLAKFYDEETHDVNWDDLDKTARYSTRFLDNVIDSTPYFFDENKQQQLSERRVGLNNMGLAELMVKLEIRYGSDESVAFIDKLYGFLARAIYETSVELAQEKGAFPQFKADQFLKSGYMQSMPKDIQEKVRKHGIRNVTLTTQAPTGTTGTMVNTSTGIEPFFSWVYYRKSRLGLHEEQVPLVKEWFEAHPGETELPDYFVTAMDLSPEEHIKVQAAIQRWVDSSISKTCNVPNEYTVEQVSDLYLYMYDMGCKGGTIYRDGSRDEQVLMLKGDERAESEMSKIKGEDKESVKVVEVVVEKPVEQVATPHRVYPRPKRLSGVTVSRKTPFGTAFITMNSDELGNPFEVFITIGKAGSDLQADAEGLGRMLSLQLRTTAPQNRMEMLKLIVEQLQGIGGSRSVGMGPQRVISLPDAVAGALVEHYLTQSVSQQLDLPMGNGNGQSTQAALPQATAAPVNWQGSEAAAPHSHTNGNGHVTTTGYKVRADLCPSCGTVSLIRIEGCEKCDVCGYSRC